MQMAAERRVGVSGVATFTLQPPPSAVLLQQDHAPLRYAPGWYCLCLLATLCGSSQAVDEKVGVGRKD